MLENTLSYGNPAGSTTPSGWPTFKDWPNHDSLTHEQSYYKWLERAWRGGLRVFVNLLVDNAVLCEVYPLQEEQLQRDGRRAAADQAHPRAAGLHRRAERRAGQGLVPDRHEPVRGAPGHQRGQARGGPRHRGLQALRLRRLQRAGRVHGASRSTAGSTRSTPGRARHGARQQVRQRARGRRRRQRHDRRRRQRRQQARDRQLLADAALRRPQPRPDREQPTVPARPRRARRATSSTASAAGRAPRRSTPRPRTATPAG